MKKTLPKDQFPPIRLLFAASAVFLLLLTGCAGAAAPEDTEQPQDTQEEEMEALPVSTFDVDGNGNSAYLDLLGTVEADSNVLISPATSGQITQVNAREGETVRKGDVLFVMGGVNGTEHPSQTQYSIAKTNYDAAVTAYNNTVTSTNAAIQSAKLQIQSAEHQTDGSYMDLFDFAHTLESAKDSIALIRTNLGETRLKNQRDIANLVDDIEALKNDRDDMIDDLEDERREAILDLEEMIDNAPDDATRDDLESQLDDLRDQYDDQIEDLEDQLDDQIEQLEEQYDSLVSGAILAENQIMAQLQQAYDQEHGLNTTRDSVQAKQGLYDGTSDQLLLAEQGYNSAIAQASTGLAQAKSQRDIARINLESAADQQKLLLVKAAVGGVVGDVTARVGDVVSPQTSLTEIVGTSAFRLNVAVDIENSRKLALDTMAEVKIGGTFMKAPIRTVSPSADPQSRLVNVTVELPKIAFVSNQTIEVRLPIRPGGNGDSLFIPLDAVTIGTERQFVYVVEDGVAHQRTVELGSMNGDLVEIIGGLEPGARIIVEGAKRVSVGQPVTTE